MRTSSSQVKGERSTTLRFSREVSSRVEMCIFLLSLFCFYMYTDYFHLQTEFSVIKGNGVGEYKMILLEPQKNVS